MGGKTGVNHPLGKNMIGAFYQPRCVLIDTDSLNTLPDRELASGISGKLCLYNRTLLILLRPVRALIPWASTLCQTASWHLACR